MKFKLFYILLLTQAALLNNVTLNASAKDQKSGGAASHITLESSDSVLAKIQARIDKQNKEKMAALGLDTVPSSFMKDLIDENNIEKRLHCYLRDLLIDGNHEHFTKRFLQLDPLLQTRMATMSGSMRMQDESARYLDNDEHGILTGPDNREQDMDEVCARDKAIANQDLKQRKLLHYATIFSYNCAVIPLLDAGANPCDKDYHEKMPVYYALKLRDLTAARTLIERMPNLLIPINEDKHILAHLSYTKGWTDEYIEEIREVIQLAFNQMINKHKPKEIIAALDDAIRVADDQAIENDLKAYKEQVQKQNVSFDAKLASANSGAQPQAKALATAAPAAHRHSKHERRALAAAKHDEEERERKKRLDVRAAQLAKEAEAAKKEAEEMAKKQVVTEPNDATSASGAGQQQADQPTLPIASTHSVQSFSATDDPALQKLLSRTHSLRSKNAATQKKKKSETAKMAKKAGEPVPAKEDAQVQKKEKKSRMEELDQQAHNELYKVMARKLALQELRKEALKKEEADMMQRGMAMTAFFTSKEFAQMARDQQRANACIARLENEWQAHQAFLATPNTAAAIDTYYKDLQ